LYWFPDAIELLVGDGDNIRIRIFSYKTQDKTIKIATILQVIFRIFGYEILKRFSLGIQTYKISWGSHRAESFKVS
jgi:hypothetical protein